MSKTAWLSSGALVASIAVLGAASLPDVAGYKPTTLGKDAVDNFVRGKAALNFEDHYNKQFPVKTFGTNLWGAIEYGLFHEGRRGVVIGKDDWLFTDEEFKAYADADARIDQHLKLVAFVQAELKRRGITLVVTVLPAKARLYSELVADRKPTTLHRDLLARAQAALTTAGVPQVHLQDAMTAAKAGEPIFLRTDTHWTPAGAVVAAKEVARQLAALGLAGSGTAQFKTTQATATTYKGDLLNYLPLDPYFAEMLPPGDPLAVPSTETIADEASLLSDSTPMVALVGTSYSANERWNFGGALQEALHEDVVNHAQEGKGPFVVMLDYLAELKAADAQPAEDAEPVPRVVIWEIPERYFPVTYDYSAYKAWLPVELVATTAPAKH